MYIEQDVNAAVYDSAFDNLKKYILYSMGYPVIRIELTTEHLVTAIVDAIQIFYNYYAVDVGMEVVSVPSTLIVDIPATINKKFIKEVIFPHDAFTATAKRYALGELTGAVYLSGGETYVGGGDLSIIKNFDLANYYLHVQALENIKRILAIDKLWDIVDNKIHLYPKDTNISQIGIIYGQLDSLSQMEQEPWIKSWSYSRSKFILGTIRSKMSGMSFPTGSFQTDGEQLKTEAQTEMDKLMEDIKQMRRPLPLMQIG